MRGTRGDQAGTRVSKFAALEAMRNESPSSPWATATSSTSKCSTNGSAAVFVRRTWNYGSALGTAGAAPYRRVNPPPHGLLVSEFVYLRVRRARSSKAGLPPRTPRRMGCRPRCFNPSLPTRHATGSSLHQPGRPRSPAGSPVRAPRWSSAEVPLWHQRGGKGRGTAKALSSQCGQHQGRGEVKGSPVRSRGPGRLHWSTQRGSDRRAPGRRARAACPPRARAR